MQSFINKLRDTDGSVAKLDSISKKDMNRLLGDLRGELDAIVDYNETIEATQNEDIRRVLTDIRNEEQAHVGQLMNLILRDQNFRNNYNMGIEQNRDILGE